MLDAMAGRTAPDLEETMREPLALTCFLPAAAEVSAYAAEEADTGYIEKRPERVTVRPVVTRRSPAPARVAAPAPPPWRPARARPVVRPVQAQPPRRKVLPRAETVRSRQVELPDLRSLAMFWGVALAGSLVAIGIALTAW